MQRYLVLLKLTDTGMKHISDSPARADAFIKRAEEAGAKVEAHYWLLGEYDGALILSVPDEATAVSLMLILHKADNVHTHMLRALDSGEIGKVLQKLGS